MRLLGIVVALALSALPAAASAEGAVASPADLPLETRSQLAEEIAAARKANPGPFAAVASVRAKMAELDANKRGRMAPVSLLLKPIGSAVLLPLIEQALFEGPRGDLNDSAWLAWQVGLVETLGMLRDTRSLPVLDAALRTNTRRELVRAAAEAIGRLGTDEAARLLVAFSSDALRGEQVRSAMGNCRRLIIAQSLAAHAERVDDAREATTLARALSDVGNAWAWETPAVRDAAPGEERAVRDVAAGALVRLFVRFDGPARQAASNALLVVDAPTTSEQIEIAARAAPAQAKDALATLAIRFGRNPAR